MSSSQFVKVFGCRPPEGGAARTGAGVRKPPREETAGRRTVRRVRRYGDFGADEEHGRACWEAVDVLGEFVLSIGVGRTSIGSGDRSTMRLSVVARRRA